MTCICENTWRALCALKDAIVANCSTGDDNQPLAASCNNSNISVVSSNLVLDDHVINADLGLSNPGFDDDSFTSSALDDSPAKWRPKLRFHDPVTDEPHLSSPSHFTEVDLGDGAAVDEVDAPGLQFAGGQRTDSQSSTRESGYGRSLDDSNASSSPEPSVSVAYHAPPNPGVFKVVVQNETKCWFVLRCYSEFLILQEVIRSQVDDAEISLPVQESARHHLDRFIQGVMVDPRIVALPEVREFLQLDRCRGSTSTSSGSSSAHSVQLDPHFLMPPGAPPPGRKSLPAKTRSITEDQVHFAGDKGPLLSQTSIDLGCTEKKSLTPSDFEFLTVVGKGSFGRVMLARYLHDQKVYAVKVLNKRLIVRRNETAHVLSERAVLIKMLNHPYLVQLHFAFTTTHKIFFVLDYINGGELFFHLQKERVFPEPRARFYAAEMCCALAYMHSQGIVYRDLKPENILLDAEGHIVLTDFGLCKEGLQYCSSQTATFCGTPEYLAPEILKKQPYSRAVDWWTLGAVLYEMLYGLPPFYSRDTPAMYDAIMNKSLRLKSTISQKARDILQGLLQKDPKDRLGASISDGDDVKNHEFFKTINWDLVARRGIPPPFTPTVFGEAYTGNVDPMFTKEAVLGHSPASPSGLSASVQAVDHVFQGFSYAPPLEFDAQ